MHLFFECSEAHNFVNNYFLSSVMEFDACKTKHGKGKENKKETDKFDAQVICLCSKKCAQKVDVCNQEEIFEKYKKCKDWPEQTLFLRSLISAKPTTKKLDPIIDTKMKENSYQYHLFDGSGSLTQVCLRFFIKVLQVSRSKVFRAVDSIKKNPEATEMRGGTKSRRTDSTDMKYLKDFIRKFVSYESSRNSRMPATKCLHPRLSIRKIYQLYSEDCVFKQRKIISETLFRKVFHNDFNLKLVEPAKPKCRICKSSKNEDKDSKVHDHIEVVRSVKSDLIDLVEQARMPAAKIEVLTFQLQRAIDLPHISNADVFCKQQLWFNVFTIHDEVRNITYFYVWDEAMASRGSDEIISCLFKPG